MNHALRLLRQPEPPASGEELHPLTWQHVHLISRIRLASASGSVLTRIRVSPRTAMWLGHRPSATRDRVRPRSAEHANVVTTNGTAPKEGPMSTSGWHQREGRSP